MLTIHLEKNLKKQINKDFYIEFPEEYYWYLHPILLNLYEETGKMIDLYSDAELKEKSMELLEKYIQNELTKAREKNTESWQVNVGKQLQPEEKEVMRLISKTDFIKFLEKFLELIAFAKEKGEKIKFAGD